ncbi:MAG: OprD family outer membrane porin [Sulfurospirillaceae bacterium]|nr:OprD family outer membrane porin [Sulfurospirillaceae bacterium]MDD2827194.1 OprD family outer membrane porin [Sulfurospirillaceae bacterium]
MKLAKLSLAAIVVAGLATSTFAADTLADAFKNGKVKGELKAYYFDKDNGKTSEDIFSTGVTLGYVTDSLYGLSLGVTFQSSYSPFADDASKTMFAGDMYGSGAVLSEAYLAYTIGKTTAKVGRQFISTPLVNGSGSRIIKESFEGAVLINTDLPKTTLIAAYVSKFQGRTSNAVDNYANDPLKTGPKANALDSDIPEFTKTAVIYGVGVPLSFDGAYTAAVINTSITNLTLVAQYALVNDVADSGADADVFFADAGYVLPLSNMKLGFGLNYRASKTGNALDALNLEGDMFSAKIDLIDLAGFGGTLAYSGTSNDDDVILGMGNGCSTYTAPLISGAAKTSGKNTDAYKIEATYDFSKAGVSGLKVLAQYVDIDKVANDETYVAGEISYAIPALKGLSLSAQYEDVDTDEKADQSNFRFRANYKF